MHGIEIFWGGESQFGWSEMYESADDMVQIGFRAEFPQQTGN
jgi:hypothetical protein